MNEKQLEITPAYIINLALRRRWFILLPFCLALIGGIYYAIVTPGVYEAKTLILVEGQRVPQNFVQSIVTEETSERINTISQQILSRTNLEKIIKEFSLFVGSDYGNWYVEDKIAMLRDNIHVNVITDQRRQTDAFEISFKGKDPRKVMRVVNGLATSFIDENLKVRESQALGTSSFLESELTSMRNRLEQLEESIKNYRKANMGELPEQLETNLRILERLQDDLSNRQHNIREAKIRLSDLTNQANFNQPSVVVIGSGQQGLHGGGATLDELIVELESLQSRYTEKHPDIIRLKRQIAEMESRQLSQNDSAEAIAARIPPQLRAQINEARREIDSAGIEVEELERQIEIYQKRIENTPKREQELLGLRRDYQNIQASYDSLLNRKLEADIGVNMERKQKGEQFRIVDPAKLPRRPVEPDMKKVFVMVIVLGLGLGCGLAYFLEFLDSSFKKSDDLERAVELQVLVTIPRIMDQRMLMCRRINNIGSIAFTFFNFCLLGLFGLISVRGVEPLVALFQ